MLNIDLNPAGVPGYHAATVPHVDAPNVVWHDAAINVLKLQGDATVDLVYTDPPFGTGDTQKLARKKAGQVLSTIEYNDPNANYLEWLKLHLVEIHRVLKDNGTLYLHLDWRWSHRAKVLLDDEIFGAGHFLNEIVWSYNFGGRGKTCWAKKHDTILVYVKDPANYVFNYDDIPRIPYKVPAMQKVGRSPEEAQARIAAGQVPTDVWEMSIVGTNAHERNGYPTQKPVALTERIVLASSPKNGLIMDCFAGSGTTGEVAHKHGRRFLLADTSPWAIEVMRRRFEGISIDWRK